MLLSISAGRADSEMLGVPGDSARGSVLLGTRGSPSTGPKDHRAARQHPARLNGAQHPGDAFLYSHACCILHPSDALGQLCPPTPGWDGASRSWRLRGTVLRLEGFAAPFQDLASSPFMFSRASWAQHPQDPTAGVVLKARRGCMAEVGPGERPGALSQSWRLLGPVRKIPASCSPTSSTSPAAQGFL